MSGSVAAAVFAGGASVRMGTDKADVIVDGVSMLEHVVDTFQPIADEVFVVGGRPREISGARYVADTWPGEGPVGALLTAFDAVSEDVDVIVSASCDLARLNGSVVGELVAALRASDALSAVPLIGGVCQWHLAAWRRRAQVGLRQAFDQGTRSMRRASGSVSRVHVVSADLGAFVDFDTPEAVSGQTSREDFGH